MIRRTLIATVLTVIGIQAAFAQDGGQNPEFWRPLERLIELTERSNVLLTEIDETGAKGVQIRNLRRAIEEQTEAIRQLTDTVTATKSLRTPFPLILPDNGLGCNPVYINQGEETCRELAASMCAQLGYPKLAFFKYRHPGIITDGICVD